MIRNRIIFGILWVLSVVGISFYGGPVSYGLFLMMTFIPVISLINIFYVFFSYRIYQEIGSKNLTADQGVPYYITLQNEKKLLFSSIRVRFYSSFSEIEGIKGGEEYEMAPGEGIRLETQLICKYRGEYLVGVKKILITDMFRLFCISFNNSEPLRVVVKPDMSKIKSLKELFPIEEITENRDMKDSLDVISRAYYPGDDPKRINWKQSAGMDELYVRNETGEEKKGIVIIPDTCRYSKDEHDYIPVEDSILRAVLSISRYYSGLHIPVTLAAIQNGASVIHFTAHSDNGFLPYYENVSGIMFDKNNTDDKASLLLPGSEIIRGENNIIIVRSGRFKDAGKLPGFLENMGKSVKVVFAGRE